MFGDQGEEEVSPGISVIIVAKNEQDHIGECLKSVVDWVEEVILVDDGSTDGTLQISSGFSNVHIFKRGGQADGFERHRAFAIAQAGGDWILQIDADERVPADLVVEIRRAVTLDRHQGYRLRRRDFYFGGWIEDLNPWTLRLYRKEAVEPSRERVHGECRVRGSVGEIWPPLVHTPRAGRSIREYVDRHLYFYTDLVARDFKERGIRISCWNGVWYFVGKPISIFLRRFLILQGWRLGWRGLLLSIFSAMAYFISYAKLWKTQNDI
ncbi:MAG: glycosyltransferase family 2 protein [Elusimicrobia bacterium]|nr:glycosyltransferase family 2 protein [Elusimicrobiota bacterium]